MQRVFKFTHTLFLLKLIHPYSDKQSQKNISQNEIPIQKSLTYVILKV